MGVNPHKQRKKGFAQSLETEMHDSHGFIQQLKGASISSIAICPIKRSEDSLGRWNV